MIRTGLIGFGLSGTTFHLPFLTALPDFDVTRVLSSQVENVGKRLPSARCFSNIDDMLADSALDLVVITSPNDTHFPYAVKALQSGCHVLLEKPAVTNFKDALKLDKIAKESRKLLCVYHNRRWDGDFLSVCQLKENGTLGDIKRFESRIDRFRPVVRERWRELPGDGAGILYDLGPHLIDQALQLFGVPKAIGASCRSLRPGSETTDYFSLTFHYDNNEVILGSSPYRSGTGIRFQVDGTKATFLFQGIDSQEQQLREGMAITEANFGKQNHMGEIYYGEESEPDFVSLENGIYAELFTQLAQAIRNGAKEAPVTILEAAQNIYAIELAEQASRMGLVLPWQFPDRSPDVVKD
ncbi:Gfo/Idh/MocA family oxidoreductase [Parasalinivibrio latis]|uniref:Gfo/Idh/MocA family oxidoreductase n=1 Tax=Parasalinivibrio latis TaxID=2952610 RepID=UPI0030DF3E61